MTSPNPSSPPSSDVANDAASALTEPAPPRATWSEKLPEGPWCPDEWVEHLDAVAPGLRPPDGQYAPVEATGTRATSAHWSLLVASRRGRLHAHRGEHREDAGTTLTFSGGWCAAVADGAGSAKWSRLGSAIATHVATHALREALGHGSAAADALPTAMTHAGTAANNAMRQFAERTGLALRDLRTTLLVAAAHGSRLATLQVGDGAIALLRTDHSALMPHVGDSGEFSGEVTHFLPDDGAVERLGASLVMHDASGFRALLLATDGVEDPWYPLARHATALFEQISRGVDDDNAGAAGVTQGTRGAVLHAPDPVHALMQWLAFEKRGENDDRTLFVAWVSSPSV